MPVIKSNNAPTNLTPFSMKDIEAQARAILMRAQQHAEQLLVEAQISAGELKDKALAEGIIEGRKTGIAKGTEEGKKLGQQQALAEHKAQLTQVVNAADHRLEGIERIAKTTRIAGDGRGDQARGQHRPARDQALWRTRSERPYARMSPKP